MMDHSPCDWPSSSSVPVAASLPGGGPGRLRQIQQCLAVRPGEPAQLVPQPAGHLSQAEASVNAAGPPRDRLPGRHRGPAEQQLAVRGGAVQGAPAQGLCWFWVRAWAVASSAG